jgi:methionyl-tRNA synthetase
METISKLLAQPQVEAWGNVAPWVLVVLIAWSLVWKGLALWKAARLGSKPWFVILLIVNTLGLLEIIYFFFVGKKDNNLVQ